MKPLTVALVGCGKRARVHAAALRRSGAFRLVALCDVDEGALVGAAADLGVDRLYSDPVELIDRERPDLVDVVTRPGGRAAVIERLVDAGAEHILLEKPIALLPSEVERIRRLGERAFLAVNTQYGWMPHWRHLREVVATGGLGDVLAIHASTRTNALEQGSHVLDLALRLADDAGLPPPGWVLAAAERSEAFGDVLVPADLTAVIGLGDARLYWSQGPSAPEVQGETTFWYHIQLMVLGTDGILRVTLNQGWSLHCGARSERGPTSWPADDDIAQAALFDDLADAIRTGKLEEFPTAIDHAAACSDLIFACFASAARGRRVEMPCNPGDRVLAELTELSSQRGNS